MKVDDHSRITFTKKTKNIFPVQVGDSIALYQSTQNENNLIFNLQRGGTIIDTWICKRGYVAKKEIYTDNIISDNNNIENNRFYTTSATPSKSNPTPGGIVKTTNFSVPNNLQTNSNSILEHDSNYYNDRSSIENAISNNIKTKSAATKSIMIVDDEQDILFAFRLILNEIGDIGSSDIRIETFENSIDALLFFTETDPSFYDLVIIDIKMPGINGFQLYKIMKALTRGTSTTNFYLCLLLSMQKS